MKKILFFLFCIIGLWGYSQDEYYRIVDWKFYPENIVQLTDSTYITDAVPFDYNDQGSISRIVGNYIVDFVGHRYSVIDSTSTTITVLDIYHTGQAPQTSQVARCYRSVGNGAAEFIGSVDYSPLDESARWKLNGSDNELLWRHISGVAANGLHKDAYTIKLGGVLTENTEINANGKLMSVYESDHGIIVQPVTATMYVDNDSTQMLVELDDKYLTIRSDFANTLLGNRESSLEMWKDTILIRSIKTPTSEQTSSFESRITPEEIETYQYKNRDSHINPYEVKRGTVQDTTGIRYVNIPESYFEDSTLVTKHYVDNFIGTVSDATTTTKGIIQLAGDLSGTSASPTVVGLSLKAPLSLFDGLTSGYVPRWNGTKFVNSHLQYNGTNSLYIEGIYSATGGMIRLRDVYATGSNQTFMGIEFNSAPGFDWTIGKYSNNTSGLFQIRDQSGNIALSINESHQITFPQLASDRMSPLSALSDGTITTIDLSTGTLSGTNVTWDYSVKKNYSITLTGNTVITISNVSDGDVGTLYVTNAATPYTITLAGYVNSIDPFIRLGSNMVITSGGSKSDDYTFKYNGSKLNWNGTLDRH